MKHLLLSIFLCFPLLATAQDSIQYEGIVVKAYRIAYVLTESEGRSPATGCVYVIENNEQAYLLLTVTGQQVMIRITNTFEHAKGVTYTVESTLCGYDQAGYPVIDKSPKITISRTGMTVQSCNGIIIFLWYQEYRYLKDE